MNREGAHYLAYTDWFLIVLKVHNTVPGSKSHVYVMWHDLPFPPKQKKTFPWMIYEYKLMWFVTLYIIHVQNCKIIRNIY